MNRNTGEKKKTKESIEGELLHDNYTQVKIYNTRLIEKKVIFYSRHPSIELNRLQKLT